MRHATSIIIICISIIQLSYLESRADKILSIPLQIQEQSNWCWAASSQAILEYYGKKLEQCVIVNWVREENKWGSDDCCLNGSSNICNQGDHLFSTKGSIKEVFNNWNISNNNIYASYLGKQEIIAAIDSDKPFIMNTARRAILAFMWNGSDEYIVKVNPNGTISDQILLSGITTVSMDGFSVDRYSMKAYLLDGSRTKIYVANLINGVVESYPIVPGNTGSRGFQFSAYKDAKLIGLRYNNDHWEIISIDLSTNKLNTQTSHIASLSGVGAFDIPAGALSVDVVSSIAYILDRYNKIHVVNLSTNSEGLPIIPDNTGSGVFLINAYTKDKLIGLRYNNNNCEIISIDSLIGKTELITKLSNINGVMLDGFAVDPTGIAFIMDGYRKIHVVDLLNNKVLPIVTPSSYGSGGFGIQPLSQTHVLIGNGYSFDSENVFYLNYLDSNEGAYKQYTKPYDELLTSYSIYWYETIVTGMTSIEALIRYLNTLAGSTPLRVDSKIEDINQDEKIGLEEAIKALK